VCCTARAPLPGCWPHSQPDKNSPDVAVNDEHAMMRFEFLEAIVRLGA
jgi:hypothetical protein